jgi:PAS domain-containing protein
MACLVCHSRTSNWSHVRRRRDITELVKLESEQKKTIDALYQNEEKLRLILENISEGIIVANADKNYFSQLYS